MLGGRGGEEQSQGEGPERAVSHRLPGLGEPGDKGRSSGSGLEGGGEERF